MAEISDIRKAGDWMVPGPAAAGLNRTDGGKRRALLLDRDGVINVDHGYVHTADATEWIPGTLEIARAALDAGRVLVVVTNQAGIGRGYYSDAEFRRYTEWVHQELQGQGVPILATYYCPEHPDAAIPAYRADSGFRKPEPGMLLAAARDWNLDLAASVLVGDQPSDIEAARRAGVGKSFLTAVSSADDIAEWIRNRRASA